MKYFQKAIDLIRGKDPFLHNIIWNKIISNNYIIIPIGTFCLPRVITTFCHLKRNRSQGEKSYPFDLAFFNNINKNIFLIENHFENFYEGLEYDNDTGYYINTDLNCIFNHDCQLTLEEFKTRYNNRIQNFYQDICNKNKKIYFVLASFEIITTEQINTLIYAIKKYRNDNFKIILLYCNLINLTKYNSDYIKVIDNIDLNSINNTGNWVEELRNRKTKQSKHIYKYLNKNLRKLIK